MAFLTAISLFTLIVTAQFPPPHSDLTIINSKLNPDVKISYKETGLCETTPGVRSFSGFVHLPRSALDDIIFDFDINTYFLYFEARREPENAPLVIYLAGGPGESSAFAAMGGEGGPCFVNLDGNTTTLNPWSFNNYANLVYIDQPVGAGFSYTSLINGTHDAISGIITPLEDYDGDIPKGNATFGIGTYPNPAQWLTTNTTISSAHALWHFAKHWVANFPELKSSNKKIGIWGNSAGGLWAPATGALFHEKLRNSSKEFSLEEWTIDNVGITNGLIDFKHAMPYYIEFAHRNPYGSFLDNESYIEAKQNLVRKGGCQDLLGLCHVMADEGDSLGQGTNETVNKICREATRACVDTFGIFQLHNNVSAFDIAMHTNNEIPGGDPCPYYLPVHTFLNHEWTQKELGVPLNFTYISNAVLSSFTLAPPFNQGTGAAVRTDKRDFEYLLRNEVQVALVYGDRDSRCPWVAAEGLALTADYPAQDAFTQAGYQYIQVNDSYRGGVVRQVKNLSFSRVFQAGHGVNTYQPATVDSIFSRAIRGLDIATGMKEILNDYSSQGPLTSFYMQNETLPEVPGTCMVLGAFQNESVFTSLYRDSSGGEGQAGNQDSGKGGFKNNAALLFPKLSKLIILTFAVSLLV